ncbi:hypothetical protein [Stutzerimonas nitrititolerans]|uniref:hypothetical protein n=1 Tax=Stutzerimonas nitrititolerans TaxID=2482751 RepID=UPI0011C39C06|nr:hypothetical protein [Stutzerimonas nitrititolerans]
MPYLTGIIPLVILLVTIGLGLTSKNWFIEFGLAIVVCSAISSIALALSNARNAARARKTAFESFLPEQDSRQSASFKFTESITGLDRDPIISLQKQVKELQKVAIQDENYFRQALLIADRRIDICLAQIKYHEQATLPQIIGQGSGTIVLAAVLTIVGSVFLAIPDQAHTTATYLAEKLCALVLSA